MRRGLGIVAAAPCPDAVWTRVWRGPGSCPGPDPQRVAANSLLVTPNKNGDVRASTSGGKSLILE